MTQRGYWDRGAGNEEQSGATGTGGPDGPEGRVALIRTQGRWNAAGNSGELQLSQLNTEQHELTGTNAN